ncbi:serine/threonine/dual specificity protein kinase, catalytic domain-containing protein [Artemisia annua]|uniref:Serine/threonine/dual specificity protein kinase, catalytic domain-containing protein n=1 Tax=Artemisia annua TaxID=35608 RepID=A0A2U1P4G8_ARTAN|nr:serine/threonine/dual specificity protein kinase, catalytic domain-containing protein [Artemisia annua]
MYLGTGEGDKLSSLTSSSTQSCRRFSLAEIQSATENFGDELVIGQGGFGKVYKGHICFNETSHVVAIKRLDSFSTQGEHEFRAEIEMLSKLRHPHLVSLIGYCNDNKEMILVYEYMPHGALHDHLHKDDIHLSWVQRLKVAIGAARGLDYLHKGGDSKHGIIHRDVKSSNILLDENWEAMISDFGLSKIIPVDHSFYASVKGTFGYLDPEYFYTKKQTRATDVYAFGVLLFELLSGRLPVDIRYGEEQCSLVRWAKQFVKERKLEQMVDSKIKGTISSKCLRRFAQIANRCLDSVPKERPTMTEVVALLEALLDQEEKVNNLTKSTSTSGFTWNIYKYIRKSTRENHDQRHTSLPMNLDNYINRSFSTKKEIVGQDLKVFTYEELRCATRGFAKDTYLGAQSYGEVYKGWVDKTTYSPFECKTGMPVVIKSLSWNRTVDIEKVKLELEMLKEFSHPNLVKLIGYCLLDKELFLVNEYMPNGNFEEHLLSGAIARLPLVTKVKIALGIARGIVFLHNTRDDIHVYSQWGGTISMFRLDRHNILLDEDFTVKLSDYEVTKLLHEPFQLQSNFDGFTLVLTEVLTGTQISYENDQKIDELLVQHGKMPLRRIARLFFEMCNEVDSESNMLTLLEEYEIYKSEWSIRNNC